MTVLESMGAGVPVVATSLGGLPELVARRCRRLAGAGRRPRRPRRRAHRGRRLARGRAPARAGGPRTDAARLLGGRPPGRARRGLTPTPAPQRQATPARRCVGVAPPRRGVGMSAAGGRHPVVPVRVLYLTGSGRSGTTVINSILGQLGGAFAGGELRYLWRRGVVENHLCGCGRTFDECPVWKCAVMAAPGRPGALDGAPMPPEEARPSPPGCCTGSRAPGAGDARAPGDRAISGAAPPRPTPSSPGSTAPSPSTRRRRDRRQLEAAALRPAAQPAARPRDLPPARRARLASDRLLLAAHQARARPRGRRPGDAHADVLEELDAVGLVELAVGGAVGP